MSAPTEGAALHALLDRAGRLPSLIGKPERFAVELDDIIKAGRKLANLQAPRSKDQVLPLPPRPKLRPGTIRIRRHGRSAQVVQIEVKKARAA
jgi:hypothetical protein